MSDKNLVVDRWKRYGKDRLYVSTPDGVKVGFWDVLTGEAHPESPENLSALLQAVENWKGGQDAPVGPVPSAGSQKPRNPPVASPVAETSAPTSATGSQARAVPAGMPVARPWLDLATNEPGAESREQAVAAREAAPVRTVLARVLGVHTDERAWRIGADGEEKVAAQLAKLQKKDARWRSLHAIPVGDRGSDIDHILIGPGGIFTVNTKNHPGAKIWVGGDTFLVDGHRQSYIRNSRYEAGRAAKLLTTACGFPVYVQGLIVTVNAADVAIKAQPDGVHVTWRNNLVRWVLRHGDILTPETVDAIYEVARRSTTWQP